MASVKESTAVQGNDRGSVCFPERQLRGAVARLFRAVGVPQAAAERVSDSLVDADLSGIPSHGVMLVPLYLDRLRAGSVSVAEAAEVIDDTGSTLVLDAHHILGQLSSHQAVDLLGWRTPVHGMASVAVRNAFHFGAAGYWTRQLASRGLIGVALSNTRPLMPAPGGAERVVGNNPLSIAVPSEEGIPIVLDMAMSASAMGKIRLAAESGQMLPAGWAADAAGKPTTDPSAAIAGMLLPTGGAKGFGLAFLVDLLCGGLSSGALGAQVQPLYGDSATPYGCAHFFLAIDVQRFLPLADFAHRASEYAQEVRASRRAPGTAQLFTPGERTWSMRQQRGGACPVAVHTQDHLRQVADDLGLDGRTLFQPMS
ncbi:MAG TPA: Ldh family oxidoreductase [Castellaniella sp.]|uniref:Ldh family oxidoreductase n=1 Tax=Castellaniella sp. TaxID=1955812 RepID=UPI002EF18202